MDNSLEIANRLCQAEIVEQKPSMLVANGKGTRLYNRSSLWGRIWSIFHHLCGTHDATLAKVIRTTADHLRSMSQQRQNFSKMVEAEGVLGTFWKRHSIAEMHSSALEQMKMSYEFRPNALQFKNFMTATHWANEQLQTSNDVTPLSNKILESSKEQAR